MKHYKSVEFLLTLNVKPILHKRQAPLHERKAPRTNVKPVSDDFLATVLTKTCLNSCKKSIN